MASRFDISHVAFSSEFLQTWSDYPTWTKKGPARGITTFFKRIIEGKFRNIFLPKTKALQLIYKEVVVIHKYCLNYPLEAERGRPEESLVLHKLLQ